MGILNEIDTLTGRNAPATPAAPEAPNSFSQGLRQGITAAGGQVRALAGGVAEAVGAKEFAAQQYAASKQAEELAATQAPEVNDWRQVTGAPDLGTGLRRAGSYVAGLAGQSVPAMGLGAAALAGMTKGGVAMPMLAATGAVAPLEIGGALQRQQADPEALKADAATRLNTAVLEGSARAGLSMAVPTLMGAKLAGKALAPMTMGRAVVQNLGEGVVGNAAAGVAGEGVSTLAMDSLNANRDTSGDAARYADAAAGGAALGLPFAGTGIAAHAVRGPRAAPRTDGVPLDGAKPAEGAPAEPAAPKTLGEKIRGWRERSPEDTDTATAEKVAAGQDLVGADLEALKKATPEEKVRMLDEADASTAEKVKGWFNKMREDASLSPEERVQLDEAGTDLGSRANQALVAGLYAARNAGKKAVDAASDFLAAATRKRQKPIDGVTMIDDGRTIEGETRFVDDPKKSEMGAGAQKLIADTVTPILDKKFPQLVANEQAMSAVTRGLSRVMDDMAKTGKIDDDVAQHLRGWFGNNTPAVLAQLHDRVLGAGDLDVSDRYFGAVNKMTDDIVNTDGLHKKLLAALPEDMQDDVSPPMLRELSKHIREYVRGEGTEGKPPAQVAFERRQVEDSLREHFGDKTDEVLSLFEKERDANKPHLVDDKGVDVPDDIDYALNSDDGFADHEAAGKTTERDLDRQYIGKNKSETEFMPSEQLHRQLYGNEGSQAARLLREATAEHADKNVSYVTARQYAHETGVPLEHVTRGIKDYTGNPDDHVMVKAEGQKSEGLTWRDVDSVRLDTHKYPDSKSRIETENGDKFDAVKVLKMYAQESKLPRSRDVDVEQPLHRLRRQFSEAIASLSDHIGEAIHVDDDVVVGKRSGKELTWGELQEQGRVKADEEQQGISHLYNEREIAVKEKDARSIEQIDNELAKLTGFDGGWEPPAGTGRLGQIARQLGAARQRVERVIERNVAGPLTDAAGKRLREPTGMERNLIREHDLIAQRYLKEAAAIERRRAGGEVHDRIVGEDDVSPDKPKRGAWATRASKEGDGSGIKSLTNMESANFGGASEIAPDGQIHLATEQHGEQLASRVAKSRSTEDLAKADMASSSLLPPAVRGEVANFDGRLPRHVESGIASRVSQFENGKSAAQLAIGKRGRFLVENMDRMRLQDKALLASIVKEKNNAEAGATINEMYAKYKGLAAKKPDAFVERVLGKGDLAPTLEAIRKTDDVAAIRRVVDALAKHADDPRARQVLDAADERVQSMLDADPDVAYSMQRTNAGIHRTGRPLHDVENHINKVLGRTVDVEFKKMLHAGEFVTNKNRVAQGLNEDVIRVSVHALDPMGTAYHESLHAFFKKLRDGGLMQDAHPILKAADSPVVKTRLRELLAGEPDALKQLDNLEERAAYMYQFWAKGDLVLPTRPSGILGHVADFFRRVMGVWTNDARAVQIMEYFHSGEYAREMKQPDAVRERLQMGTNRALEEFQSFAKPLTRVMETMISTGDARLRGSMIPALAELADKVYAPLQGEFDDPGYMPAARTKRSEIMNGLARELARYQVPEVTDALAAMQRGEKGATPREKAIVATVRKVLDDAHAYMLDAGVNVGDLGVGKDYFPRVWDAQTILKNEADFRTMLERYRTKGDFHGSVDQIIATLTRADGSELQTETVKPGMQYTKERVLGFVSALDAAPFMQKDAYQTLNSYITQATRRAEWARRFSDDGSKLHDLLERAKQEGATPEQLQTASDYLQGVDGTLGDKINPKLRRLYGNMIVYQNVRLLPLAIFSSLIDPGGIMVRGGTAGDAFRAMKRGFSEIPKGFKKDPKFDAATDLAAQLGVIDDAVLQHAIGSSYSQGMTSDMGRKINDTFFKYNLMEQFNRSMRVAATEAAVGFLGRHADGTASPHSPRWLAELGMKPGEFIVKNGKPLIHAHEFEAHGMTPDAAKTTADKMTLAINKWVDGAILRPNAAHKPVWMNDPRFALVSHLKQFVYSFQETILKRVANEARFGNIGPAYALAGYVPFMIAADVMKGALVSGGGVPNSKEGWDLGDYLWNGMQRAGLFGVGQFGIDTVKDIHRGGLGIGALTGPALEQVGHAASVVGGPEQFSTFAMNALPANQLLDAAGEATASTNAID